MKSNSRIAPRHVEPATRIEVLPQEHALLVQRTVSEERPSIVAILSFPA